MILQEEMVDSQQIFFILGKWILIEFYDLSDKNGFGFYTKCVAMDFSKVIGTKFNSALLTI